MVKKLLFILTLLTCASAHAEYVFYKETVSATGTKTMAPITESEHAVIYPLLMKYQFPMSLNHDLDKELSPTELALYDRSEEEFLRSKINQLIAAGKLPTGTKIAFIPTTLYELVFVQGYIEQYHSSRLNTYCNTSFIKDDYEKIENTTLSDKEYTTLTQAFIKKIRNPFLLPYFSSKLNTSPTGKTQLQCFHNLLNDYILNHPYIASAVLSQCCDDFIKATHLITPRIESLWKQCINHPYLTVTLHAHLGRTCTMIDNNNPLYKRAITQENSAHKNNLWLLYRGTELSDGLLIDTPTTISRSYGNSLLAGIFRDARGLGGACAHNYMAYDESFPIASYTLAISKEEYRKQGLSRKLFSIPTHSTILAWGMCGETFHPRSTTYEECRTRYPKVFSSETAYITAFKKYLGHYGQIIKLPRKEPLYSIASLEKTWLPTLKPIIETTVANLMKQGITNPDTLKNMTQDAIVKHVEQTTTPLRSKL